MLRSSSVNLEEAGVRILVQIGNLGNKPRAFIARLNNEKGNPKSCLNDYRTKDSISQIKFEFQYETTTL